MASFKTLLLILSVLSFAFHALAQSVVVISDAPGTTIAVGHDIEKIQPHCY